MSGIRIAELLLLPLLIVAMLVLPVCAVIRRGKSQKSVRRAFLGNLCAFGAVLLCAIAIPMGGFVHAAETTAAVSGTAAGLGYLAAALAVGLGSIGCGVAVGGAAPAAIGAIAEEPKAFAKALIFVALGEGVAIYGLLIAIMILNQLS